MCDTFTKKCTRNYTAAYTRSKLSVKSVGLSIERGKLVCLFHKEGVNLPCRLYKRNKYKLFKKAGKS